MAAKSVLAIFYGAIVGLWLALMGTLGAALGRID